MLLKVGNDDMVSFKNNNKWLENHPSEALIFSKTGEVWQEMQDSIDEVRSRHLIPLHGFVQGLTKMGQLPVNYFV